MLSLPNKSCACAVAVISPSLNEEISTSNWYWPFSTTASTLTSLPSMSVRVTKTV